MNSLKVKFAHSRKYLKVITHLMLILPKYHLYLFDQSK